MKCTKDDKKLRPSLLFRALLFCGCSFWCWCRRESGDRFLIRRVRSVARFQTYVRCGGTYRECARASLVRHCMCTSCVKNRSAILCVKNASECCSVRRLGNKICGVCCGLRCSTHPFSRVTSNGFCASSCRHRFFAIQPRSAISFDSTRIAIFAARARAATTRTAAALFILTVR